MITLRCENCGGKYPAYEDHDCLDFLKKVAEKKVVREPTARKTPLAAPVKDSVGWRSNKRWRERNPEKYRDYMRKYMRARRSGDLGL